jgi:hypothetical protein
MSVGHIARLLETAGIPTVIVAVQSFRKRLEMMTVPRALLTPHLMGRPIGRPGDRESQKRVLQAALHLLETADQGGTIVDFKA